MYRREMEYTPYVRQLPGRSPETEARIAAFFEEMVARIDLRALLMDMMRDKQGMTWPDEKAWRT